MVTTSTYESENQLPFGVITKQNPLIRKITNRSSSSNIEENQDIEKIRERLFKSMEEEEKAFTGYVENIGEQMEFLKILLCHLNSKK